MAELIGPFVDGIKIGLPAIMDSGASIIRRIKNVVQRTIIADFKIADIGFFNANSKKWEGTNSKIIERLASEGADYIICHSIIGTSSIQECINVAHNNGAKILTLPFMTHRGASLFFEHPVDLRHVEKILREEGLEFPHSSASRCRTISDTLIVLSDLLGVDGFIGPANNPVMLRRYRMFTDKPIFGPGIGRQAGKATISEQLMEFYSICGPKSAAIIGSLIYMSNSPESVARDLRDTRDRITSKLK